MVRVRHGGTVRRRIREGAASAGAEGRGIIPSSQFSFPPTPAGLAAHPSYSHYFQVIPSNSNHRTPPRAFHGGIPCGGGSGGGRSTSRIKTDQVGRLTGPLRFLTGLFTGSTSKKSFVHKGPYGLTGKNPWKGVRRSPATTPSLHPFIYLGESSTARYACPANDDRKSLASGREHRRRNKKGRTPLQRPPSQQPN